MRQLHRIYHDSIDDNGDRTPWTLWAGSEYPSPEDIGAAVLKTQGRNHDPFLQTTDDYISVQKKRRIGWKTLDVINLFEAQR